MPRRSLLALVAVAALSSTLTGCFGHHNVTGPSPGPAPASIIDSGSITPQSTDETTIPDTTGDLTCTQ